MFDYQDLNEEQIVNLSRKLPKKMLRWLGANHMDNRTRLLFFKQTNIEIGNDTVINQNFIISDDYKKLLKIGERVAISPNVTIICTSAPNNSKLSDVEYVNLNTIQTLPVTIHDDVWIGTGVIILPGVEVGKFSIIASGSVVTKHVDSYSIYAGIPAKKIKELNDEIQ